MGEGAGFAIALLALIGGGIVLATVGWYATAGRLPMNPWAGIRTPFTMSSQENWTETHRAGGPILLAGGLAATLVGIVALPFVITEAWPIGVTIALLGLLAILVLACTIGAWLHGTRVARRTLGR